MQIKRAFPAFIICCLLLLNIGITFGSESSYTRLDYLTVVEPTIDGIWTSTDE